MTNTSKASTNRRHLLLALATVLGGAAAGWSLPTHAGQAASAPPQLRIGYQKGSLALVVLKERGTLAQRLQGTQLSWVEFPAGPQLLEALAVGSIDFGSTGDSPPIFAQSAGKDLVYVGYESPAPEGSAVVVPKDSSIRQLADLKGKRVALQKGSSAHYLAVQAIKQGGLKWADIQPVYLPPADARAALERGAVDAWVIWDPYYAAIELSGSVRVIANSKGLSSNNSFYLASSNLARHYPASVAILLDELSAADRYTREHPEATAQLINKLLGQDEAVTKRFIARRPGSPILPLTPAVVADQQAVADSFFQLGLIPRPIKVADAVVKIEAAAPIRQAAQ